MYASMQQVSLILSNKFIRLLTIQAIHSHLHLLTTQASQLHLLPVMASNKLHSVAICTSHGK